MATPVINSTGLSSATQVTRHAAPTLDARNTIPLRLGSLSMPAVFFAELCGFTKVEFSRLMSGAKSMSGTQTIIFCDMLTALEAMAEAFKPMELAWRDIEQTRTVLAGFGLLPDEAKDNIHASLEILRGGISALGK